MTNRPPRPERRTSLVGRDGECALLDEFGAVIRRNESRSLVLRGEAGIGKTALLEYLAASASDLTVVRAAGAESDMGLAYASLHQVCAPLLNHLDRLPPPQRQALELVFGRSVGAAPGRFLVGLAVLSLFSEAADERPLLCLVDDAQWLDKASALTLAFVARRLLADPVGIVFAAREPGVELRHLPELEVRGLVNGDAGALLSSAVRFKLDERIRDRIIEETRGNPLALLQLPRGLTATELAGGFGLLDPHRLPGRIEESCAREIMALDENVRRLLVLAAAEPLGDPMLLLGAAEQLGIVSATLDTQTRADGLLSIGNRVTFRHPLVRAAAYWVAPVPERLAVHLALAEVTDPVTDPDVRAWHLAAAAAGPNEQVALALERSADRAQERGGLGAAAAFLQRGVELTRDPSRRAERALSAAHAALQAGAFDAALRLLETAEASRLDGFQRARVTLLRGQVALVSGFGGDAPRLLLKAARELEPSDLNGARDAYLKALAAAMYVGHGMLSEICAAVQARPQPPCTRNPVDLLLDGLASLTTEGDAVTQALQRAARAVAEMPDKDVLSLGRIAGGPSSLVWDLEGFRAISARQVRLARDAGALGELPTYLSALALTSLWIGDFAEAASLSAEIDAVSAATGAPVIRSSLLMLRSLQGREANDVAAVASDMQLEVSGRQESTADLRHWATAVLHNGLGRYQEALLAAQHAVLKTLNPWISTWALPELVEAAVRCGQTGIARDALERLAMTTQPTGTNWGLGILARSRALSIDGADADGCYREAVERLSRTNLRPEVARAHLVYGEWLRREGRRIDAREQLRAAYEQLSSIGMEAFSERARKELLATGEKARKRCPETRDQLTRQEWQIAELARDGLSNREIGARLFLSHRTVESHLSSVFSKLGIRNRRELANALPGLGLT